MLDPRDQILSDTITATRHKQHRDHDQRAVNQGFVRAETLQRFIEDRNDRRTEYRADRVTHAAEQQHRHQQRRGGVAEAFRADETDEMRIHRACHAGEHSTDHKGHDLVLPHIDAHTAGCHRILTDGHKRAAAGGFHDTLLDEQEDNQHDERENRKGKLGSELIAENGQFGDLADALHGISHIRGLTQEHMHHIARGNGQQSQELMDQVRRRNGNNRRQDDGDHHTGQHSEPGVPAEVHRQNRRGIRTGRIEHGMTQSDLSGITEEDIQAGHRDGIDRAEDKDRLIVNALSDEQNEQRTE